jgi:hypothetical protein
MNIARNFIHADNAEFGEVVKLENKWPLTPRFHVENVFRARQEVWLELHGYEPPYTEREKLTKSKI